MSSGMVGEWWTTTAAGVRVGTAAVGAAGASWEC